MFQPTNLTAGDVFILSSQQIERYLSLCTPLDPAAFPDAAEPATQPIR